MPTHALQKITDKSRWRAVALAVVAGDKRALASEDFGTYWIVAGHTIREQVSDDDLLSRMLRQLVPAYEGGSITLYRGENLERWQAKKIGFSWTNDVEVARMFGRGLNATRSGGVLIRGEFPPSSVICGPNSHSVYLQEAQFTVDPSLLPAIEEVERYPPA